MDVCWIKALIYVRQTTSTESSALSNCVCGRIELNALAT